MNENENGIASYFLDENTSDFTIKVVDGHEEWNFPVHTEFLKQHSPVFKAMLESKWLETEKQEMVILDFRFSHVMEFLRRPEFESLSLNHVKAILSADHLNVINEMEVLQAGLRWIKFNNYRMHSPDEALAWRKQILNLVRWNFIDKKSVDELIERGTILKGVDMEIDRSARIPEDISFVDFSNVVNFAELSKPFPVVKSERKTISALRLISHEPSKIFIIGFEMDYKLSEIVDVIINNQETIRYYSHSPTLVASVIYPAIPHVLKKWR